MMRRLTVAELQPADRDTSSFLTEGDLLLHQSWVLHGSRSSGRVKNVRTPKRLETNPLELLQQLQERGFKSRKTGCKVELAFMATGSYCNCNDERPEVRLYRRTGRRMPNRYHKETNRNYCTRP